MRVISHGGYGVPDREGYMASIGVMRAMLERPGRRVWRIPEERARGGVVGGEEEREPKEVYDRGEGGLFWVVAEDGDAVLYGVEGFCEDGGNESEWGVDGVACTFEGGDGFVGLMKTEVFEARKRS
jgi:hypothetical protein